MKHVHRHFSDKKINFELGMGTAKYIDDVLFVKCHACFELMEASTSNFYKDRKSIARVCKGCYEFKYRKV